MKKKHILKTEWHVNEKLSIILIFSEYNDQVQVLQFIERLLPNEENINKTRKGICIP